MEMGAAAIIGRNVKERREALGMKAKTLGEMMGAHLGKESKPWPPQTVYMLEAGDRAMVATEVVALAEVLDLRVADLFAPPAGVTEVTAGTLRVPAARLAIPTGEDTDWETLADIFEAVGEVRGSLYRDVMALWQIVDDARAAIRGEGLPEAPRGDGIRDTMARSVMDEVDGIYERVRARRGRSPLPPLEDVVGSGNDAAGGEG